MAFWRAPWDFLAHPTVSTDDDFTLIERADATSEYGVRSIVSTAVTEPAALRRSESLPRSLPRARSCHTELISRAPWDELSVHASTFADNEHLNCTISSSELNALALAGRRDGGHIFSDLRSTSLPTRRLRSDVEKYYNYRGVSRGQLGSRHVVQPDNVLGKLKNDVPEVCLKPNLGMNLPSRIPMNKRDLYKQARKWPRPPTYHRRRQHKDRWPWVYAVVARREDAKHAWQDMELGDERHAALLSQHDADYELALALAREESSYDNWLQTQTAALTHHDHDVPAFSYTLERALPQRVRHAKPTN